MEAKPFTIREAILDYDAPWFATRLRESDLAEVLATHDNAEAALRLAIEASAICVVAELEGVGVIILGCAIDVTRDGVGIPWLLATPTVERFPGALTKIAKHYVGVFRERWPVLLNFVDQRNVTSVRWLRRLGFTICEPLAFGKQGELFHPFTLGA